ncbi:carbohydrate ABC transporter permease [Kaistia geumhonensis]|uniref:ABC-type glycerol-3-phosphate transport system permease component n=1 Tax=Kaistia geumhonensis TaxID=410839 RepID=A0ABU0M7B6_9HYPH|nr:carbohydrate ABC transporter permease [Kaistia geumhonensis]MCX5477924.1 carbohydrate ABC transporter permease [Kaistia geumhonensis]MDQ0516863.1 ABC-type glycerol-3-phosphate transport system permease component [Kaistia geumhonensis]
MAYPNPSPAQRWTRFGVLSAIVLVVNLPIILMVMNSFQTTDQLMQRSSLLPHDLTTANYSYLSERTNFWRYLWNSVVASTGSTITSAAAAALAGYALSRFRGRFVTTYSRTLFIVQMFPIILALIPLFILFRTLGLINSPLSVIILYTVVHLPFATWMARSFFDTIPRELEEAALVDGCSRFGAFLRIVLPLSGPGLAAIAIFSFLFSYNEFFVANVFLRDENAMTLPVGITMFMQQYSTDWGSLMAAATLTVVPTFILFLGIQKYITYGAVSGGVKG